MGHNFSKYHSQFGPVKSSTRNSLHFAHLEIDCEFYGSFNCELFISWVYVSILICIAAHGLCACGILNFWKAARRGSLWFHSTWSWADLSPCLGFHVRHGFVLSKGSSVVFMSSVNMHPVNVGSNQGIVFVQLLYFCSKGACLILHIEECEGGKKRCENRRILHLVMRHCCFLLLI